ncbi:transcriptional regulator [Jeotgalibacillus sp. S-D1]|uniref:transcriptional regulator SplA domain-containing protein n=1 Tax=Jeotgalibacillus sp. S-D1 TaxID=2552189 RepID=UPI00105A0A04|nr:transcriptional regulator SplA domain-containing protein [Jeotgalibacillus sp. S-D1]TDL32732.1 transcriptional regulator [Jeotgalibacillus sp. S-D1]
MFTNESHPEDEVVYVIIRNPHAQGVANVQEATVVQNPEKPGEKSLFMYDTYYPLTEDVAVYHSAYDADNAFREAFGLIQSDFPETENFYG